MRKILPLFALLLIVTVSGGNSREPLFDVPWDVNCQNEALEDGYINFGYCIPGLITEEAWLIDSPTIITGGISSYEEGVMERVIANRGLKLTDHKDGIAVMSCGDIGKTAFIKRQGYDAWEGPFMIADCSRRVDMYVNTVVFNLVAEVGYKTAEKWECTSCGWAAVSIGRRGGESEWFIYSDWWLENAFELIWKPWMKSKEVIDSTTAVWYN